MTKPKHIIKMAPNRHATSFINHSMFTCVLISLWVPIAPESAPRTFADHRSVPNDDGGRRLTREYDLRQGALRGLIVKPNRHYDLQNVEMFLGIPYAAPPVGNFRFMPPVSAPSWPGVKMATRFAPVCPQALPAKKKDDPQSLGRQRYMERLEPFLAHESEDCLYLNIYVPYREQKSKKFPVLVFIHGDSFEWSSGNPYDGRILASYGNIMVITFNYRLGVLGFLKPSMREYDFNNNGLLDQLAALQWIKDNIKDLNGDPNSVTLMGHGTGAASVSFLMLSHISHGLFHRAILMSGSALSDWALTKDPTQYTSQVAQSLGCNPKSKNLMKCLQGKPLAEIRKVTILSREFETPLGAVVAGSLIPDKPVQIMASFPNLLSKYELLCGVTEYETYHDFGAIELEHGILETQRDEFITKYAKLVFEGAEDVALKEILKQYSPSKLDPQRWNVETNREVILNLFSDARTLSPLVHFANYHSKANRQSYFYVFGHNSVSTHYAPLNKSVHGEELPYVLGVPLGGTNTHFHSEYTPKEKLLSEVIMRLWTNFVKIGTPNTQSLNKYLNLDRRQWDQYNKEWPEYNIDHQSYLKLDIPPHVSSFYRSNYTTFWIDHMPNKMKKFVHDHSYEFNSGPAIQRPKANHRNQDPSPKTSVDTTHFNTPTYGRSYYQPDHFLDTDFGYRQIQSNKNPTRAPTPDIVEKSNDHHSTIVKSKSSENNIQVKASGSTIILIVSLSIIFLAVNVGICAVLCFKKRKMNLQDNIAQRSRHTRAKVGEVDIMGQKSLKEDKNALRTLKSSCSVIKSMSINKLKVNNKNKNNKQETCKTPKSDDSGGFRERFQLRRHLSTSTLDAHTKVRDWIANEVMHRCSPNIMRKINTELDDYKHSCIIKPFTRSEEILSESKDTKYLHVKNGLQVKETKSNHSNTGKSSEKNASTYEFGSHSSVSSKKRTRSSIKDTAKSTDSLKSKGTESIKSKTVSVAIDATPSARTNSVLQQEPIELTKSFDDQKHSEKDNEFHCSKRPKDSEKIFTNEVKLSFKNEKNPMKVFHKHSNSDPLTDTNYDELLKNKLMSDKHCDGILPPVIFRNDINVTSKDHSTEAEPLSTTDALLTIKRRNFPKVLPDFPQLQKRLSLQPTELQTFRGYTGIMENESDYLKVPPIPPPRTTTLDRRLAFKYTKPLSSFEATEAIKTDNLNYENIEKFNSSQIDNGCDTFKRIDSSKSSQKREYPKVIIASSSMNADEPKLFIHTSPSQISVSSIVPRVKLPEDFHCRKKDSITSFSSVCSDDEDFNILGFDYTDDIEEDKLIQELVGGIDTPTNIDSKLDSKGPATIFEKKLEIIPVRVNTSYVTPKSGEDYVCVTDLQLPDISDYEKTAQIKPNYGINKLKQRSESIQKPPEKAVKVVQKVFTTIKPTAILQRGIKNAKKCNNKIRSCENELEHSNSGSSNDTEASTGTVKKISKKF